MHKLGIALAFLVSLLAMPIYAQTPTPFRTIQGSQDPTGPFAFQTNRNGQGEIDLYNMPNTAASSFCFYQATTSFSQTQLMCLGPSGLNINVPPTFPANTITNSMLAQMPANTVKCNPTGSTANVQDCPGSPQTNVKTFGALGNSNGTPGNGHDDTAAISAAIDSGDAYFPCGTYRTTSTITKTSTTANYRLHGDGACSQIYLDTGVASTAFNFAPASSCTACVRVEGLNFINPTTPTGSTAINLSNETTAFISNNIFTVYQIGVALTNAFAPIIDRNVANSLSGTLVFVAAGGTDKSLNGSKIWRNSVFGSGAATTSPALALACNGANGVSVLGNDLEANYAGVQFTSCTSVDFSDNYVENSTAANFTFTGTNVGFTIRNNWFGASPTTQLGNVSKAVFAANTVFNWAITWASTATGVILEPTNLVQGTGSIGALPSPTPSACGTGSPSIGGTRLAGTVTEGTTATGCTITFELPFDKTPACVVSTVNVTSLAIASQSTTALQVTNASQSGGLFTYVCQAY